MTGQPSGWGGADFIQGARPPCPPPPPLAPALVSSPLHCIIHTDNPTDSEDFNFADIERFIDHRKLDNDVSEAKALFIDVSTLDTDCGSVTYSARILTTQRVVPQNRCAKGRMNIGETNDEIIRPVGYN